MFSHIRNALRNNKDSTKKAATGRGVRAKIAPLRKTKKVERNNGT
jgi:hypothetical protein